MSNGGVKTPPLHYNIRLCAYPTQTPLELNL